jgi:hypothetical protein
VSEDRGTAASFEALAVPPPGRAQDDYEVLRAAIAQGNLHVSPRRAFDAPEVWAIGLADMAWHIDRIHALEAGPREQAAAEKVRALFAADGTNAIS